MEDFGSKLVSYFIIDVCPKRSCVIEVKETAAILSKMFSDDLYPTFLLWKMHAHFYIITRNKWKRSSFSHIYELAPEAEIITDFAADFAARIRNSDAMSVNKDYRINTHLRRNYVSDELRCGHLEW